MPTANATENIPATARLLVEAAEVHKPIKLVSGKIHEISVERTARAKRNQEILAHAQGNEDLDPVDLALIERVIALDTGEELKPKSTRLARFLMGLGDADIVADIAKRNLSQLKLMRAAMDDHDWEHKGVKKKWVYRWVDKRERKRKKGMVAVLHKSVLQKKHPVRDFAGQFRIVYRKLFLKLKKRAGMKYSHLDWDTFPHAFLDLEKNKRLADAPVLWKKWDTTDPRERLELIMKWSSMPGTSRHHWGTDVDIIDTENAIWEHEPYKEVAAWLEKNGDTYGFRSPYGGRRNFDYMYGDEPWHICYFPIAKYLLPLYQNNVRLGEIPADITSIPETGRSLREEIFSAFRDLLTGDAKGVKWRRTCAFGSWPGGEDAYWEALRVALNTMPLTDWVFNIDPRIEEEI